MSVIGTARMAPGPEGSSGPELAHPQGRKVDSRLTSWLDSSARGVDALQRGSPRFSEAMSTGEWQPQTRCSGAGAAGGDGRGDWQ